MNWTKLLAFLTLAFFAGAPVCLKGQTSDTSAIAISPKKKAQELVKQLHDGVLIVRLASNRRKIEELTRLANSPDATEKQKARYQRLLEDTKAETRRENLDLVHAFRLNYKFSKVLFMYDTSTYQLQKGISSGYFLNQQLELDPAARLDPGFWMLAYLDYNHEGMLLLLDQDLKDVKRPFPVTKKKLLRSLKGTTTDMKDILPQEGANGAPIFSHTANQKTRARSFLRMVAGWNIDLKKYYRKLEED